MDEERIGRKLQTELRKEVEREKLRGLDAILAEKETRRWLWHLLSDCGVFRQPYSPDAGATAFACGERNFGLQVLNSIVEHRPDALILMMKENKEILDRKKTRIAERLKGADDA